MAHHNMHNENEKVNKSPMKKKTCHKHKIELSY